MPRYQEQYRTVCLQYESEITHFVRYEVIYLCDQLFLNIFVHSEIVGQVGESIGRCIIAGQEKHEALTNNFLKYNIC